MYYGCNIVLLEDGVKRGLIADINVVEGFHVPICQLLYAPQALNLPVKTRRTGMGWGSI